MVLHHGSAEKDSPAAPVLLLVPHIGWDAVPLPADLDLQTRESSCRACCAEGFKRRSGEVVGEWIDGE